MKTKTLDEQIKIIRWNPDNGETKTVKVIYQNEELTFSKSQKLESFLANVEIELNDFWKPIYDSQVKNAIAWIA